MSTTGATLTRLLEPVVCGLGYELVGVDYERHGRRFLVRLYIDHADGITLEDCEVVSHQVSGVLDVEDPIPGYYTLEVSSPGLDRPLFKLGDYQRFAGEWVKLRLRRPLDGRRNFRGQLVGVEAERVIVDVAGERVSFGIDEIEQARLIPQF